MRERCLLFIAVLDDKFTLNWYLWRCVIDSHTKFVNIKFLKVWKSNNWKVFYKYNFLLIKWWAQFFVLTLLQKSAPLILSPLWSWLEREIFFTLIGRWIKQFSQWTSGFELVRDFSFFKFFKSFEFSSSSLKILGWNSSVLERLDPLNFNNLEFLKFMEAFELDFNRTSSLGRMIQVNSFECSLFVLEAEFLQGLAYWKVVGEWERSVLYL